MSSLPEKLLEARKKRGYTQADLARKSGVSQQGISRIERGDRSPNIITIGMLAAALDIPMSEFMEETAAKKSPAAGTGDGTDGLREEIIGLIGRLPEEALPQVRDYAEFLRSRHEKRGDPPGPSVPKA